MILSIESSCDDSAVALTRLNDLSLVWHRKISQEADHARYGGVVPELASRLHAVALPKLLEGCKGYLSEVKAIAVTNRPGLAVTLHEGIAMAKTLAYALEVPLIAVHHLKGHIYSLFIEKPTRFPLLVVLISGGHTMVVRVNDYNDMTVLATSMDDSVGESFDKVAKMMGLGYPGGPVIEALAKEGDEDRFDFPVPLRNDKRIAFSLSGLKNAVRVQIEALGGKEALGDRDKRDIAASFQKAVRAHLLQKCKKIFRNESIENVAVVGGAAANRYLLEGFARLCETTRKRLHTVDLQYCSDNAAMIGRYGVDAYLRNDFTPIEAIECETTRKLSAGAPL